MNATNWMHQCIRHRIISSLVLPQPLVLLPQPLVLLPHLLGLLPIVTSLWPRAPWNHVGAPQYGERRPH